MVSFSFFQPSVWSLVRRITLPPSYADWTNFSFIPLKNLTDHSHKDGELVSECETLGKGCVGYPRLNKRGLDIRSVGQHFSVALIIYENGVCMAETGVPQLFVCLSRYQF